MLIGYARVSRDEGQDTAAQRDALERAGAACVYAEHASGGRYDRDALHQALDQLNPDDVLVVTKLDRLSRSLADLLRLIEAVEARGAGFRSLGEAIDTTTPAGRMMMQMIGSFAEYERAMIRERTQAGLDAARRAGRVGGRRRALTSHQRREAIRLVEADGRSQADVARLLGVSPATVSRVVAEARAVQT